ncbi:PLC-like phosphodiesterase [Hypoxylon crocopeplum]|nr:PLC-like phosphodiesterase [Hypoxylon crocopeplum]
MRGPFLLLGLAAAVATADLSQFALQKVLQNGREVFGDTTSDSNASSSPYKNWMSSIPDSTPLSQLNIPGLHDPVTWNYTQATQDALSYATRCDGVTPQAPRVYRCQRRGITHALDAGVRFFDLRFALDPLDRDLVFWHGPALVSAQATVPDVLFAFFDWLDRHPTEVVLLSFQYEGGTKADASFDARAQELLFNALTQGPARAYVGRGVGRLGTLGENRGKIVLLRRFDMQEQAYEDALPGLHLSPAQWPDNEPDGFALVYNETTNATAFVEDYYEPVGLAANSSVPENVAAKVDAVRTHLRKAAAGDADGLFITFASGEHNVNDPPVFPETMALGNGTEVTPDGGVNHQLASILRGMCGSRLGVVVLDFFDEPMDLVGLILGI